jgi:5-methyltetrahydrofolate--homocysteine methyltransferase
MSVVPQKSSVFDQIATAAAKRILVLDEAMGTQIQRLGFGENEFTAHGAGCACHPPMFGKKRLPQQGNNDLLILTQAQAIEDIHYAYAKAGADIVETNTFSSTSIAQADYGLEHLVYDLNFHGAGLVRKALDGATAKDWLERFAGC